MRLHHLHDRIDEPLLDQPFLFREIQGHDRSRRDGIAVEDLIAGEMLDGVAKGVPEVARLVMLLPDRDARLHAKDNHPFEIFYAARPLIGSHGLEERLRAKQAVLEDLREALAL